MIFENEVAYIFIIKFIMNIICKWYEDIFKLKNKTTLATTLANQFQLKIYF